MTKKHTRGPWTVVEGYGCFVVETDDRSVRFECNGLNAEGDRANACLISAAPDLLAVAFDYLEVLGEIDGPCECGEPECRTTRLRAAIAKATGSQS